MPRFVLLRVRFAVASTARRIVSPSGVVPARAKTGPVATALAMNSSYDASPNGRPGETFPGFGALASRRHAICVANATSSAVGVTRARSGR